MGQARQVMDQITEAILEGDREGIARLYAEDAVADTPDEGRLVGREAIVEYLIGFSRAFPDLSYDSLASLESGDTAIDEGYISGVNSGPLLTPDGEIPATGKTLRMRSCDLLTVKDGVAVSHRFHFDQLDFLTQLGLAEPDTIVLPESRPAAARSQVRQG